MDDENKGYETGKVSCFEKAGCFSVGAYAIHKAADQLCGRVIAASYNQRNIVVSNEHYGAKIDPNDTDRFAEHRFSV
ncbi:hypothetical protein Elgi_32280 [Paenibacillus elgii]|uniref:hypothetical protein n=1 Tax=Paenibacillus elgii TaxID=189691 RepID=UPI002D7D41B6|nr:hypothetical protein Elgi_32280 [Paenibacillus elgii]